MSFWLFGFAETLGQYRVFYYEARTTPSFGPFNFVEEEFQTDENRPASWHVGKMLRAEHEEIDRTLQLQCHRSESILSKFYPSNVLYLRS